MDRKRTHNFSEISVSQDTIKRKKLDSGSDNQKNKNTYSEVIATHYNEQEDKGLIARSKSRIIYLRTFHNWIKSMLVHESINKIRNMKKQHNAPIRVHDMCCGKGGDLLKWKKSNIAHLICSDIAEVSLEHCRIRYDDMKDRMRSERGGNHLFTVEMITGDCTRDRLREKFSDPSMKLELVSCQFAFHYSFESLPQAENMMKNAAECLLPGGYFIGTIPNANEIISRARKSKSKSFGNDLFLVSLDFDIDDPPLFGARYDFQLDGVVNCPEFLVHFPTFTKLAKKFGLKLIEKENFVTFYERKKIDGKSLLVNMNALETYSLATESNLLGTAEDDYTHAKEFVGDQKDLKIGTLSKSEWEASSLYMTFVFEKMKHTWNTDGTPRFED